MRATPVLGARRRHLRLGVGLGLCVLAFAVTGCGLAKGFISTVRALNQAGFANPDIQVDGGSSVRVTVTKDTEGLGAAATEASRIIWHELPVRIDEMTVTCSNGFGGRGMFTADRASLESRFGPRDPRLDRGFREADARTAVVVVVAVLIGGLLVLSGIILLIVVLVRRNRGVRPPAAPPPGWGTQPPPPGYGPPP